MDLEGKGSIPLDVESSLWYIVLCSSAAALHGLTSGLLELYMSTICLCLSRPLVRIKRKFWSSIIFCSVYMF